MKNSLGKILLGLLAILLGDALYAQVPARPNILFIAIDDLKPMTGCYGHELVKTPNIDRLAARGTVFLNNYCQQAVCGPTRASLMTGMRPDYTRVYDLKTLMRDMNPDIVSLPQYLVSQGYSTQGIGKVYDPRCVDKDLDKPSWSVPYYKTDKRYYDNALGEPATGGYQKPETKALAAKFRQEARDKGLSGAQVNDYVTRNVRPTTECLDVPDNAYTDGANVLQAKDILAALSKSGQPFFFAIGLSKPHLPFVAPKKYWDLYKREQLPLTPFQEKPDNAVEIALHNAGELRQYTDIPDVLQQVPQKDFGLTLPQDKQRELLHGYYAAISYTDANVGALLQALDSLGLAKNTIVVLWGDHGWHLGDHNLWCKHSNFEQATRAPLIISAPGIAAGSSKSPSEFVDVFPTLCELAGVPVPAHLQGKSLAPVMRKPKTSVKDYAISQYPRSASAAASQRMGFDASNLMGYSLRTARYRYTVWMKDGWRSTRPYETALQVAAELYDYEKDPEEKTNVAADAKYKAAAADMQKKMLAFFAAQVK